MSEKIEQHLDTYLVKHGLRRVQRLAIFRNPTRLWSSVRGRGDIGSGSLAFLDFVDALVMLDIQGLILSRVDAGFRAHVVPDFFNISRAAIR